MTPWSGIDQRFQRTEFLNMDSRLLEEVKEFVAEALQEPKKGLSAKTSITDDLGVGGDDGAEFMQSFSERFAVDLTAFPYEKYFGSEAGATPLTFVVGAIRRVTTGRWSVLTPLTLGDLADAAARRSWKVESPL